MIENKSAGVFKSPVFYLVKLFIFWILLFFLQKIIFLAVNYRELSGISFSEIIQVFVHSAGTDVSAACYLLSLPLLLVCIGMMTNKGRVFIKAINWINFSLICINLLIFFSGIGLYKNWGTKINSKALSLLIYPKESIALIFNLNNLVYFGFLVVFIFAVIFLFRKTIIFPSIVKRGMVFPILFLILFMTLLFIGARGGFQKYPLGKSSSYFSQYSVLNSAALNDFWNILNLLATPQVKVNHYTYFAEKEADKILSDLYAVEKDTTKFLLTTSRPNIILIVLESFSAETIASLGGIQGVAPNFDKLAQEGLLFTGFYATGFRTDQGMVAILSSFPAQPRTSIIRNFEKFDKLPNLVKTLRQNGYYTMLYFGGDPSYANTESYLKVAGIHKMITEQDIPHSRRTDWGAYDEDVFRYMQDDIENNPQPFFLLMPTLTNHEYFTADVDKVFEGNTEHDLFCNTACYTDRTLYEFIQHAKTKIWYDNTLFVITADHAHRQPMNRAYNEPARHHIPFLLYGEVLKHEYRGKTIDKTGSHIDVSATLLSQLQIQHSEFTWSQNMMNTYSKGFAFYTFDEGFGFVNDSVEVVYDHNLKKTVMINKRYPGADASKALKNGKAILQKMFQEYIDL